MAEPVYEGQNYKNITATTTVSPGPCTCLGIWVSSASSTPTIAISDGAVTVAAAFTPAGGSFYPIPFKAVTSLIVTISGTVNCTVMWGT